MVEQRHAVPGPLGVYSSGFGEELALLGYSERSAAPHLELLRDLSCWLAKQGLEPGGLSACEVQRFLRGRVRHGHHQLISAVGAAPLLNYLVRLGAVPPSTGPAPVGPAGVVLGRYRQYLMTQVGLNERDVTRHVRVAGLFADWVGGPDWATVTAGDVTAFVVRQCAVVGKPTACKLVSALRSFLRFLHVDGQTSVGLWQAVPPIAAWSASSLPRWIAAEQVAALLASCDRCSGPGRRDYAVLVVLSRLALRAGEVAAMQLEDIDWRAGEMVVHGKGRRDERLPLPADVGEAIADYLRNGRPSVASRSVFVRLRAPLLGLTTQGVSEVVRAAAARAGLEPIGAHRLRHSAATAALGQGASLNEVGQLLRHRSAAATAIYAKVDHRALRALARPWPGGAA